MTELDAWQKEWSTYLGGVVAPGSALVYRRSLEYFLRYLADDHPEVIEPGQVTKKIIEGWMRAQAERGQARNTRRIRLKSLRQFFAYIIEEGELETNPSIGVPIPVAEVMPVAVVSDEVLRRLLATCSGRSFIDLRDAVILRLLLDTGCRRGELAGVDVGDVDLDERELLLRRGKGGRARVVPLSSKTVLALSRYLNRGRKRREGAETSPALLLATRERSRPGPDSWRLGGKGISDVIERRCQQAGVPLITPHQFRHTWTHDMLANGANESDVERLAGWRSPAMVRLYGASVAQERARTNSRKLGRGDRV